MVKAKAVSTPKISKKKVAVGATAVSATMVVLYMLSGAANNVMFGVQFNGTSNYTTYDTCINETRYDTYQNNHSRTITTNSSPASWEENYSSDDLYSYSSQTCTEAGIMLGTVDVPYTQADKQCIRTDATLCCWLYKDGGVNVNSRANEFRNILRSGESGVCVDLAHDLTILQKQGDVSLP